MEERIKAFLSKSFWVVVVIFAIRCLIYMPSSIYDFIGCAGESITISVIIMGLYEKWLWRYNPLEKIPKMDKMYNGKIEYNYDGIYSEKETTISIKQSLLTTSVKITTNEVCSNSISSNLVLENSEYILYYTYITNPKSKYSKENPIQYGTCRLMLDDKNNLRGNYWTSRQTIGDIYLTRGDNNGN